MAYSYGWESDYKSHTLAVAARNEFLDRNVSLSLAYTRNFDQVCDNNNARAAGPIDLQPLATSERCFETGQTQTVTRRVDLHNLEPVLGWTVTPRLLWQVGGTVALIDGFQSNPYRAVLVGDQGNAPQERTPLVRQRYAAFTRLAWAYPALRASLTLSARAYRDSWDLRAGTGEAVIQKYLADEILIALRGRAHTQTGAAFYRTGRAYQQLGPAGQYWAGDRELGPLTSYVAGFKLAYLRTRGQRPSSFFEDFEIAAKFDGLFFQLDPDAPASDRRSALVFSFGVSARF